MANGQTLVGSGFVADILADAVITGFASGVNALIGTGAVVEQTGLDARQGQTINIPYFASLGEFTISNDGTAIAPTELTSAKETATVQHAGKVFDSTAWARMAIAGDPYAVASKQLVEGAMRAFDNALVVAALATDAAMTHDGYVAGTPLSYDNIVDGLALFGDEQQDIAAIVVNSANLTALRKTKDKNDRPLFLDAVNGANGVMGTVLGIPVLVSDKITVASGKNRLLILKKGSLVLWKSNPDTLEAADPTLNSVQVGVHVYFAAHKYVNMPGKTKGGVAIVLSA